MDCDEPMMVTSRDLIRSIGTMLDLSANVPEHLVQPHGNLVPRHPNVLVRAAWFSRPLPSLIEHATVNEMNKALIQRVAATAREQPFGGLEYVRFLVLVELTLQREMRWNQPR